MIPGRTSKEQSPCSNFVQDFVILHMTTIQLKAEIQKILDEIPEDVLPDILEFLKDLQKHPAKDIQAASFMRKALVDDRKLLEKLAK
jgi:hypothetical protein